MNKKDKMTILYKCLYHFKKAIFFTTTSNNNPKEMEKEIYKALSLKELIEDTIDCQSNPYYEKYMTIVSLRRMFENYY